MELIHLEGTELWRWGLKIIYQNGIKPRQSIGVVWETIARNKPPVAFVVLHHLVSTLDLDSDVYSMTEIQKKRPQINKPILVTYKSNPALCIVPISYAEQIGVKVVKTWGICHLNYTVELANQLID